MKKIIFILCTLMSALAFGGDFETIEGKYEGEVYNGAGLEPVVTQFFVKKGQLQGVYEIKEMDEFARGTLKNIKRESEFVYVMEWQDKYGKGKVRVLFSENYDSFTGFWGDSQTPVSLPWNGYKDSPSEE